MTSLHGTSSKASRGSRRRWLVVAFFVAIATVVLAPGNGSASPAEAIHAQAAGPPQLVSSELLPDGAVRERFSNGSVYVGNPKADVQFVQDASGVTVGGTVVDPGPSSPQEAAAIAAAYAASGRSTRADAEAAGIDPAGLPSEGGAPRSTQSVRHLSSAKHGEYNWQSPNVVYDSGCLTLDQTPAYWHGCYTRKGTASTDCCAFYLADESQAAGHAKLGGYWLNAGDTQHQYANTDLIVQWNPNSDVAGNNCTTTGFSLTDFGATLSESVNNCPVKIHVYDGTQTYTTTWQGCLGSQYTPGTTAESWTHVPSGDDSSLIYSIGYNYQTSSC
jgi:hypothetical protein